MDLVLEAVDVGERDRGPATVADLTLTGLARECKRQVGYLLGCSMNSDTKGRAKRVADAYVDRVKKIFDIDMVPILVWDEETGKIEIGAEPKTDFDQILVERILAREQQEIEGGPEHRDSRPAEVW